LSVVTTRARAPAEAADTADFAVAQVVARVSSEYVLRAFQLLIDAFGDMREGLLMQTIWAANTAHLDASSGWGRRLASSNVTLPDEARRPISIARLAASTELPFESTRRIVQRLIDQGACKRVEGGMIVPQAVEERPEAARGATTNLGYVRRFTRDLQAIGIIERAPAAWARSPQDAARDAVVARIIARVSASYVLRVLKLFADTFGDLRTGIVAQTIATANTAHLDVRRGEGWRYAAIDEAPPDAMRRPISVARLAESLGLPYETVRGYVRRLADAGACVRIERGVIIPQALLMRPQFARAALANVAYVRKFMRELEAAGLEG